jgi:hypothetical protein
MRASNWAHKKLNETMKKDAEINYGKKMHLIITEVENSISDEQCLTNDTAVTQWRDSAQQSQTALSGEVSTRKKLI